MIIDYVHNAEWKLSPQPAWTTTAKLHSKDSFWHFIQKILKRYIYEYNT